MNGLVMVISPPNSIISTHHIVPRIGGRYCTATPSAHQSSFQLNHKAISPHGFNKFPRIGVRCNSSGDSGENVSRTTLDAFFLGKAIGEVLSERVESAVGEFLSAVGKFQAEQQQLVHEFQEEVFEKARQAKENAAQEALEAQGKLSSDSLVSKSSFSYAPSKDPWLGLMDED